jgi:hypothetical protein
VSSPPLALGPLFKLQTAVETTAFPILNILADPDTAASMGLHHPLVRMQLRLPLREGGFGRNATGVVPDSNAVEYQRSTFAAHILIPCSGGTLPRRHSRGTPVPSPLLTA